MTTINIKSLSIADMRVLLSQLDNEIKIAEKPVNLDNELAKRYSGNKQVVSDTHKRLKADIQIQKDILEFMNNGGIIKSGYNSNRLSNKSVKGAVAGLKLFKLGIVA